MDFVEEYFADISQIESSESKSPEKERELEEEIPVDPEQETNVQAEDVVRIAATAIRNAGLGAVAKFFSENPFADNINPGTKNGLSLFNAAATAVPNNKRIDLSTNISPKILDLLEDLNIRYQWLPLTQSVPNGLAAGRPTNQNILKHFGLLQFDNLKHYTFGYYGINPNTGNAPDANNMDIADLDPAADANHHPAFYKRVRSNMIFTAIKNNLTADLWRRLLLKKEQFTWKKSNGTEVVDGTTLIWVILRLLKSTRNVGVQYEIKSIEQAILSK
eukprot:8735478-Ditylum_brightwellii.AAC.1